MTDIIAQPSDLANLQSSQQPVSMAETATVAAAAQARAQIEARYIMAMRRPRDWMVVRSKLLAECRRPGFAATAIYKKPVGNQIIEGPSIRFMEAALRCMGNMCPEVITLYDDARKRIVRVQLTELEANLTYSEDVTIEKTVERRQLAKNQTFISQRVNSYGKIVYLVEANEGDLVNKQNAEVSKRIRNLTRRMLPGDIYDEAERVVYAAMKGDVIDASAAQKKVVDAFSGFKIKPEQIAEYLGHPCDAMTVDDIVEMRKVFEAIKSKEATWASMLAAKRSEDTEESGEAEPVQKESSTVKRAKAAIQQAVASSAPKQSREVTEEEAREIFASDDIGEEN